MTIHPFPQKNQELCEIPFDSDRGEHAEMTFDPETGIVDFFLEGRWIYNVDLHDFRDPVAVLDWTRQLSQKSWLTLPTLCDLCTLAIGFLQGRGRA